ncbi:hypothetical protein AN642_01955 [Epulopiscium sp. SCG-B10WGA-EpuloA2]|nr:hypothetical protein AN642_01955 [Epulopiscium sp. SCG-B10WGA-EpuloA2]
MRTLISGRSDAGKTREVNQDSLFVTKMKIIKHQVCMAVVSDGIGSFKDGGWAANAITVSVKGWAEDTLMRSIEQNESIINMTLKLNELLVTLNNYIIYTAAEQNITTGATVSILLVIDNQYTIAHIGDSRVYKLGSAGLSILTRDHTVIRNGKTMLAQCIGNNSNIDIFNTSGMIKKWDMFFVCTDGFYKWVDLNKLVRTQKWVVNNYLLNYYKDTLFDQVKMTHCVDDISAAIIKFI